MISHRAIIFFVPMPMTGTPSFYLCSKLFGQAENKGGK